LTYESKPVYEVGVIREKGKATVKHAAEPGNWWLSAHVKAGAFMGVLTLGLGKA
jgi:hypothetical protein